VKHASGVLQAAELPMLAQQQINFENAREGRGDQVEL
jgi:hypothetical protein